MTYYSAYITSPNQIDGLRQEGQPTTKAPSTSPLLPEGCAAYFAIRDAVQCGRRRGVQIDWGSWAALMTMHELADFLLELFGPPGTYEAEFDDGSLQHIADRMRALRAFVHELPPDELVAVVGEEF